MPFVIQDFELLDLIATNSRSTIHRARDGRSGEIVAIKLLPDTCVQTTWKREVAALSHIQHDHVIQLRESGLRAGGAYLALEWVPGADLRSMAGPHPPPMNDFIQFVKQSLSALSAAHQAGYLHRDIKPENFMQSESGAWKLIDFGESRPLQEATQQAMIGSIYFMAPEQFGQAPLTPRTDLYSLGCTLCWAVTGRYLHDGDTTAQVIASHLHPSSILVQNLAPTLPARLVEWLQALVSRQPSDRPISAALALEQFDCLNINADS
jgi:serine/threonine protein kinase